MSKGIISDCLLIKSCHIPKSTDELLRTNQRKNIQMRLHEDEVFLGTIPITCCSAKNVQRASIATIASIFVSEFLSFR